MMEDNIRRTSSRGPLKASSSIMAAGLSQVNRQCDEHQSGDVHGKKEQDGDWRGAPIQFSEMSSKKRFQIKEE